MLCMYQSFLSYLLDKLRRSSQRDALRAAASAEDLATWTTLMTAELVDTCRAMGWVVAAKGHKLDLLPHRKRLHHPATLLEGSTQFTLNALPCRAHDAPFVSIPLLSYTI